MTVHRDMYNEKEQKKPTVMVSGGFDPVHAGHIRMIRDAANFGDVIIIANSDDWLVILVDSVDDTDGTVCEAIYRHTPTFFANGGDRRKTNTPEVDVCKDLKIKLLWGVGGDKKLASSSDLVKESRNLKKTPVRASPKHSQR